MSLWSGKLFLVSFLTDQNGAPLASAFVEVRDNSTDALVAVGGANTNGLYSIGGLPDDSYKVHFFKRDKNNHTEGDETSINEWYDDQSNFANADSVDVDGTDVTGIDATLALDTDLLSTDLTQVYNLLLLKKR